MYEYKFDCGATIRRTLRRELWGVKVDLQVGKDLCDIIKLRYCVSAQVHCYGLLTYLSQTSAEQTLWLLICVTDL